MAWNVADKNQESNFKKYQNKTQIVSKEVI